MAVLLALDDARVAGEEALFLQRGAQLRLVVRQRLGEAVAHRAGLAGEAAAGDGDGEIVLAEAVGDDERLVEDHAQHRPGEIDVERLAVDGRLALAGLDPDARDGVLALAGRIGAALLVELLHVRRGFNDRRGERRLLEIGEGGKSVSAMDQALRLFFGLSLATSKTSGDCAACGWSGPL